MAEMAGVGKSVKEVLREEKTIIIKVDRSEWLVMVFTKKSSQILMWVYGL